jgi:hypothetical protein
MTRLQKLFLGRELRPILQSGWDDAILLARKAARGTAVYNAVEESDPADVIRAMGISEARYLLDFAEALRTVYMKAGQSYMDRIPKRITAPINGQFNHQSVSASQFLERYSAERIKQISTDQKRAVRTMLQLGQQAGRNPRTVALDLVGRIQNGKRVGGIIGLSEQMAGWIHNARTELESGDPVRMRNFLTRMRRDRRFDPIIKKAIDAGKPVAQADIARILGRYADRLLQLRGETIARTESVEAVGHASLESLKQATEASGFDPDRIIRTWRDAGDNRTRLSHDQMNGQERRGLDTPFTFPGGGEAMFPGDASRGAPAGEIINCRCWAEEDIA